MGMFSGACSSPLFCFIMRNDAFEIVGSRRAWPLLHDSSRRARIFGDRLLAFDFNRLRATLVAILVFVDRELGACTFHILDDSLWVGSRPCGVSELCRLMVCRRSSEVMSVPDCTTGVCAGELLAARRGKYSLSVRKVGRRMVIITSCVELLPAFCFPFGKSLLGCLLRRLGFLLDLRFLSKNCLLPGNLSLLFRRDRSRLALLCQITLPSQIIVMSCFPGGCLLSFVVLLSFLLGLCWKLFIFGFTKGLWVVGWRYYSCVKLDSIIIGVAAAKLTGWVALTRHWNRGSGCDQQEERENASKRKSHCGVQRIRPAE